MAAPTVVQHIFQGNSSAGTTVSATWPGATTLGNRLMAFVAVCPNQVTTTITGVPAGYALVNPPGQVERLVTSNPQVDVYCYEKRNAASESGAKTFTVDQSVFLNVCFVEVNGDDNAVAASVTQSKATGSAQTALPTGTTNASTVAFSLALAFFTTGNKDAHSNLSADYTTIDTGGSGGSSGNAKITSTIAKKALGSTGTQNASIDVGGGFNHSYANLIVVVPAPSGGGGGGPSFPATWDDGHLYHGCSMHYFGTIDTLAHAQTLADRCHAIVGWARNGDTDNFGGFADDIRARWTANDATNGPKFFLLPYMKSDVRRSNDPSTFPEAYWCHTCSGARIGSGSAGLQTMQPDGAGSFTDARSFTSTDWRSWKANDCWKVVDAYNTFAGAGTVNGTYLDSLFSASYTGTNCNPATNTAYTKPQWVSLLRTIADAVLALRTTSAAFANGLVNGSSYALTDSGTVISSAGILDHCHGAVAESWLRSNYAVFGTWPSLTFWQQGVNMMLDAQVTRGKYIWVITNIANDTSGSPPANWVDFTAAQVDQWRRLTLCSFHLGQRGRAVYEFVSAAPAFKPWSETHPYYTALLGTPVQVSAVLSDMAVGNGLYKRDYSAGVVIVNPSTTDPLPWVVTSNLTDPATGAVYLTGTTVRVPSHDAVLLVAYSAGANPGPPTVTVTGPANGATLPANTSCTVTATATDSDGIASVVASVDGLATQPMTLNAGVYSTNFGILAPGSHVAVVTATDANVAPLSASGSTIFTVGTQTSGGSDAGSADVVKLSDDFLDAESRIVDRSLK